MRKGQAAIEYLMNYAWAIALIIIVGVAIYGLNIGNIRTSIAGQGSQLDAQTDTLALTGYTWTPNTSATTNTSIILAFQNNGPNKLDFKNATILEIDSTVIPAGNVTGCTTSATLYSGDKVLGSSCSIGVNHSLTTSANKASGQPYTIKIKWTYNDTATGILYNPVKTISGKVQ